jgi:Ribbon-helix-helix protein, copG family
MQKGESNMASIKCSPSAAVAFEIEQRAKREGRSRGDMMVKLLQHALATSAPIDIETGTLDKIERGHSSGVAAACWLSGPIFAAVQRLAREEDRSQSWVVRDLLRCELRRRGAMPTPEGAPPIPA